VSGFLGQFDLNLPVVATQTRSQVHQQETRVSATAW
jgi:hypothetical protein